MLEGLINSLARRVDKFDGGLNRIEFEREHLFKISKKLHDIYKRLKIDVNKLYNDFLGYLDQIEKNELTIQEIRDSINDKIKKS